jgi:hypothetical protein
VNAMRKYELIRPILKSEKSPNQVSEGKGVPLSNIYRPLSLHRIKRAGLRARFSHIGIRKSVQEVGEQCSLQLGFTQTGGLHGSQTIKTVPLPGWLSTSMLPWCCWMIFWLIVSPRPSPSPSGIVVKNGSKILDRCSVEMP